MTKDDKKKVAWPKIASAESGKSQASTPEGPQARPEENPQETRQDAPPHEALVIKAARLRANSWKVIAAEAEAEAFSDLLMMETLLEGARDLPLLALLTDLSSMMSRLCASASDERRKAEWSTHQASLATTVDASREMSFLSRGAAIRSKDASRRSKELLGTASTSLESYFDTPDSSSATR